MSSDLRFTDNSAKKETNYTNPFFKNMNEEMFACIDTELFGH